MTKQISLSLDEAQMKWVRAQCYNIACLNVENSRNTSMALYIESMRKLYEQIERVCPEEWKIDYKENEK
jgi:hypothetical protein